LTFALSSCCCYVVCSLIIFILLNRFHASIMLIHFVRSVRFWWGQVLYNMTYMLQFCPYFEETIAQCSHKSVAPNLGLPCYCIIVMEGRPHWVSCPLITKKLWSLKDGKYTGCNRRNGPDFGRVFLRSNCTDITRNTFIQSWTVTEILAREKSGLLWWLRTVLVGDVILPPYLNWIPVLSLDAVPATLTTGPLSKSV